MEFLIGMQFYYFPEVSCWVRCGAPQVRSLRKNMGNLYRRTPLLSSGAWICIILVGWSLDLYHFSRLEPGSVSF